MPLVTGYYIFFFIFILNSYQPAANRLGKTRLLPSSQGPALKSLPGLPSLGRNEENENKGGFYPKVLPGVVLEEGGLELCCPVLQGPHVVHAPALGITHPSVTALDNTSIAPSVVTTHGATSHQPGGEF